MRAVSACLLFAIAAAVVSAQTCSAPSSDPMSTTGVTGCPMITTCQTALCSCTGSSSTSFPTCLSTNTGSCTATQSCYATYFQCLTAVSGVRTNTSNPCSTYGMALYVAQLSAVMNSTSFNSTTLYGSCAYDLCVIANATGATSGCTISTITSAVCTSSNLLGAATTPVPVVTSTPVYDVIATLRLSGANWSAILGNATATAALQTALAHDLGVLLGINASFIIIFNLTIGSLVVSFGVIQGSGKSPSQLVTGVNSATTSTSWLTSTSSVYSTVGTDTIAATSVGVNTTAAPTPVPPGQTPKPSSAMSAAGVWAAAAVAAIAALLA